jgi:hypothetical protein
MIKIAKIFDDKKRVKQDIKDLVSNKVLRSTNKNLEEYFKNSGLSYSRKELVALKKLVEKNIHKQIYYLNFLIYRIMELSQDWGATGEQLAKISFARNLLDIPIDKLITQQDVEEFNKRVIEELKNFRIDNLDLKSARDMFSAYRFKVLGKELPANDDVAINSVLGFIDSDWIFHCGQRGTVRGYILGIGKKRVFNGYDVYLVEKELLRSPSIVMAITALIGNRSIYIRQVSLDILFYQKWVQMFRYQEAEIPGMKSNISINISEGIKKKALDLAGLTNEKKLLASKKEFIKNMQENILYHELGHGACLHEMLDMEQGAIVAASDIYGESVFGALLEVVADFAPKIGKLKGTFQNMVDVSKKDKKRAEQLFYIYLSDIWFYDTPEEHMYLYTDILMMILLRYIKKDLSIDFKKIAIDILGKDKKSGLLAVIEDMLIKNAEGIKRIALNAKYFMPSGEVAFDYLKKMVNNSLKGRGVVVDETSYKYHVSFWGGILTFVKSYSNKSEEMVKYLKNENILQIQKLMQYLSGKKEGNISNVEARGKVVGRMKDLGVLGYKT